MLRILLLTPQLPYPPMQGTSLRNWHILRGLGETAEVSLLSFTEGTEPAGHIPEPLRATCAVVQTVPAPVRSRVRRLSQLASTSEPDLALRLESPAFATALGRLLQTQRFDVVQIEGLELARYMAVVRDKQPAAKIVLDCHNAETELQRRAFETDQTNPSRWAAAAYSRVQIGRLEAYERAACLQADGLAAVSETDAGHLRDLLGEQVRPLVVVPNCIDIEEYQGRSTGAKAIPFDLLYSGKMDYRPNVDAALWFGAEVWPALKAALPELTWAVVGQRPHERLEPLRRKPGVTVTGRVEQVQPYLEGAKVYILPLRIGSGTRLKLIEAMAAGKAIVSTTVGAEGFPVVDGRDLLLADTPEAMQAAIFRLLDSPLERGRLEANARLMAADYDWRRIIPRFTELYAALGISA